MKKVLFVIPNLSTGGTSSSLSSLIRIVSNVSNISVFALAHEGNLNIDFKSQILPKDILIHAWNCTFDAAKGFERLIILLIKLLKRLSILFKIDVEQIIYKKYIDKTLSHYDIIVGFQEGVPTRFASLFSDAHKIAWVHCDYKKYPYCSQELELYQKFDKIVCVSNFTLKKFLEIYPEFQGRAIAIKNLLNTEYILNKAGENVNDIEIKPNTFNIISMGRLVSLKRFQNIPAIAKELVEKGCNFKWYILGPHYNDNIYINLLADIKRYGLHEIVLYLGDKFNPYPYLSRSQLFVSLSETEACPMVFNEAKVLGVPVLTSDFGSSYEFIANGIDGYITSFEHISDCLYELMTDKERYTRIKQKLISSHYSNSDSIMLLYNLFS